MKPTIKLDPTRSKLNEGRTKGIGFAFLKKLTDESFEGIMPMSACKDYLNDVVYSENTGKAFSACGLDTEKRDLFDDFAYLAFSSLHCIYGDKYIHFEKESKLLDENLTNIQKMLNDFESLLKFKSTTQLVNVEPNLVLAKVPREWVSSTWAISLWAFLARNAIYSKGGDPFDELSKSESVGDKINCKRIAEKVKQFIENGMPIQGEGEYSSIHGYGILNCPK